MQVIIDNEEVLQLSAGDASILSGGGDLRIGGGVLATAIQLYEESGAGSEYVGFVAQPMTASVLYTLPDADGTTGQVLTTDGAGLLSWTTASGGVSDGDKGDITVSGSGATWTIDNDVVTYAKMQNVSATARIMGRNTAGAGDMEELDASTVKTMLSLNNVENTALSTWAGTTNITTLGTITSGTWAGTDIAYANIAQGSARSVLGVTGNATADVASIQGTADQVLRVNTAGTALAFGTIVSAGIADGTIANADLDAGVGGLYKGSGTIPSGTAATVANNTTASFAIAYFNSNGGFAIDESTNSTYMGSEDGQQFFYATNTLAQINSGTSKLEYIDGVLRVYDSDATQYVAIQAPATAALTANYTLTLPADDGTSGQYLQTDGSGALSWQTISGGGDILNGGNTTGATITIGPNDANSLAFETNNVTRATITGGASTGGAWTLTDVSANTNTVESMYTHIVNSSGVAATGLGLRSLYQLESTTTDAQNAAAVDVVWSDATHVSRTGDIVFSTVASAAALAEAFRIGGTTYALTATASVSNTNTVADRLIIKTNSSGTAAASFGGGILFKGESSTTDNQDMARISAYWNIATHASKEGVVSIQLGDSGGSLSEMFKFDCASQATGALSIGSAQPAIYSRSGITIGTTFTVGNSPQQLTLGGSSGTVVVQSSATSSITLRCAGLSSAGNEIQIGSFGDDIQMTSGTRTTINVQPNFKPTSGTAVYNTLTFSGTINQTGGSNGITRGIYLNQTLTAVADFRALEIAANGTNGKGIYQTGATMVNNLVGKTTHGSTTAPTALLMLAAGTATANTAPLKFTSGTSLTAAEAGAMEYDGTDLFFTPGSTRHKVARILTGSATLNFGSTAAGASTDLTITVTGAADGDAVMLGVPNGSTVANGVFSAWVSAADTVTVRFSNNDLLTALDPASGTFKVSVNK